MCLHFIIYICCNPVFHLVLCRLVYTARERCMKRQLRMLMNKTWVLIPVCWADTKIGPLSAACQKFSRVVLRYKLERVQFDFLFWGYFWMLLSFSVLFLIYLYGRLIILCIVLWFVSTPVFVSLSTFYSCVAEIRVRAVTHLLYKLFTLIVIHIFNPRGWI